MIEVIDKGKGRSYPRLMQGFVNKHNIPDNLFVIMLTGRNEGTIVKEAKGKGNLGLYSNAWVTEELTDYNGELSMSNL
tara:strand:+ start:77734 stop:77967 length:234 start_codon:yes stop_codon:yes gene_type:complete